MYNSTFNYNFYLSAVFFKFWRLEVKADAVKRCSEEFINASDIWPLFTAGACPETVLEASECSTRNTDGYY